jgi:lycopene cyclase domain-containing protein
MSFYLYLNLAIIIVPLIFSFEKRIKFYSKFKALVVSILIVGVFFVGWDILATYRGHWSFNPSYVGMAKLFGLPIEEILFFITVPFSCLFVFKAIVYFLEDKKLLSLKKWVVSIIGLLIIFSALIFLNKEYTFLSIISVGFTVFCVSQVNLNLFLSRAYWIYVLVTLFLFLIFNYILTSFPVVVYSPNAITGFKVTTIPIEDFLFNFSMLTNYLAVFLWVSKFE